MTDDSLHPVGSFDLPNPKDILSQSDLNKGINTLNSTDKPHAALETPEGKNNGAEPAIFKNQRKAHTWTNRAWLIDHLPFLPSWISRYSPTHFSPSKQVFILPKKWPARRICRADEPDDMAKEWINCWPKAWPTPQILVSLPNRSRLFTKRECNQENAEDRWTPATIKRPAFSKGICCGTIRRPFSGIIGQAIEKSDRYLKQNRIYLQGLTAGFIRDAHGDLHSGIFFYIVTRLFLIVSNLTIAYDRSIFWMRSLFLHGPGSFPAFWPQPVIMKTICNMPASGKPAKANSCLIIIKVIVLMSGQRSTH